MTDSQEQFEAWGERESPKKPQGRSSRTTGILVVAGVLGCMLILILLMVGAMIWLPYTALTRMLPTPNPARQTQSAQQADRSATRDERDRLQEEATLIARNPLVGLPDGWEPAVSDTFEWTNTAWGETIVTLGEGESNIDQRDNRLLWSLNGDPNTLFYTFVPEYIGGATFADFYAAVDIDEYYSMRMGIVFRAQGDRAYLYEINSSMVWSLSLLVDGERIQLTEPTLAIASPRDGSQRLALLAQGDQFSFYYNGNLIGEYEDDTLSAGQAGLAISIMPGAQIQTVEFDNFVVYVPD